MKVALVGNPNSGKTSIFNHLTGLNQKVGNYPGITVDKKSGVMGNPGSGQINLLDLPGIYSVYPKSRDEEVVYKILGFDDNVDHPDLVLVIADATNLERNLFLFTQINDMGLKAILVLNMTDVAAKKGISIDYEKLSEVFGNIEVIPVSARTGEGIDGLRKRILNYSSNITITPFIEGQFEKGNFIIPHQDAQKSFGESRYYKIRQALKFCTFKNPDNGMVARHRKFDQILTHPIAGYIIFLGIMFLIFQAIYAWAEWPMDMIDSVFLTISQKVKLLLPAGVFTNLLSEGVVPGLGGVLIFIPQIALLFGFIFILEETGYMARVVFILDKLMRPFGLNGRSVVPLISGIACAIPAIMATRTIDNWKERLITIMVTPLMSCSARLPVYTLLIAVVVPDQQFGIFNLKGLVLMGLYLLGLFAALIMAFIFKFIIRTKQKSFLVMELPLYKRPRWGNLVITILEKVKLFVWEAGKIIMAISIILWVLASYGPGNRMEVAVNDVQKPAVQTEETLKAYHNKKASVSLENSYIGIMGKSIEPVIKPLGYNWQIGIALITSFAAREVFVGSMATIYSVGADFEDDFTLLERMRGEINEDGTMVYNLASGVSLMIFYAFAMQCMSTLAVVLRETKNWKWPIIQLVYMTLLAYVSAFITYNLLS